MRKTLLFLWLCAGLLTANEIKPMLKIGFDIPLVGDLAYMGEDVRDGATLALEDSQPTQIQYKLIFEDNQLTPRLTHEAAIKLLSIDKVHCLFTLWANTAVITSPLAEKAHVIQLNTGWEHSFAQQNKWTIVHGASYQENARQNIEYFKKHGVKRLAIAPQMTAGWLPIVNYALPLLKEAGIEVVFKEFTNPGQRDFRVYLLKIKETNPDMIWAFYTSPEAEIFFRQMKEASLHIPVTNYFTSTQAVLPYIQGIEYYTDMWVRPDFEKKFIQRFGHAPIVRAGHSYDLMKLYVQSAELLYKKFGRAPTNEELLAKLKEPRELPDLVVGPGRMQANGSIETGYKLVKVQGQGTVDVKE